MSCENCKDSPYPWNCGVCHPVPPKPKHDAGCRRRKVEMDMPYICTCDMTDEGVRAIASSTKDPA